MFILELAFLRHDSAAWFALSFGSRRKSMQSRFECRLSSILNKLRFKPCLTKFARVLVSFRIYI